MTCTVTIVVTNYEDEPYVRLNVTLSDSEDYSLLEETIDSCGMKCEFIQ